MLGIVPLQTIIHKNALNLIMNIVCNKHFDEYEIAERHLVMKDNEDESWFNLIKTYFPQYFFFFKNKCLKLSGGPISHVKLL